MIRKLLFMGGFVLKTCHLFVLFAQAKKKRQHPFECCRFFHSIKPY
jgi:hypothetical protein